MEQVQQQFQRTSPRQMARRCVAQAGLCALLGLLLSPAESGAALIKLRSSATATTAVIRLGDVAEILDADAELVARLSQITLAPAPAAGRTARLDFETIRGRLATQGLSLLSLEFSGSSVVTVTAGAAAPTDDARNRPVLTLPSDLARRRLEDEVCRAIAEHVQAQARELGNVHVAVSLDVEHLRQLVGGGAFRFEATGGMAPWTGRQEFRMIVHDRNPAEEPQRLQVTADVVPYPRVVVSRINAQRGHVFRAADLQLQQANSLLNPGEEPLALSTVVGQEAKVAVRAGEELTSQHLRSIPLIRRGDIVTVFSRRPGVTVRMEAKSQSDGAHGDQVQLVSLDGRQKLVGWVVGYHEAEVGPTSPAERTDDADAGEPRLTISERERQR